MSNLFSLSFSKKKRSQNANLWDEKTIAFIILSLDEARVVEEAGIPRENH
jgi:hypothetical protein